MMLQESIIILANIGSGGLTVSVTVQSSFDSPTAQPAVEDLAVMQVR
jgi:hypothetical protein